MPESEHIPDISYRPDITDIFRNFAYNWDTLSPVLFLLFGVLAGFFFLAIVLKLRD